MHKFFAVYLGLVLVGELKADGYPFDVETHEIIGANLRLPLTETQELEVAALGQITFTDEQLGWLRAIYAKIPSKLRVIAATYNDNLGEGRGPNSIDCIWITPTEVGITLRKKWGTEEYDFDLGFEDPAKAVEMNVDFADIRIAPSGALYHRGREITLEMALELIKAAKRSEGSAENEAVSFLVTLPPPFRSQDEDDLAKNKKVADVFTALVNYGETIKVGVQRIW
ncbi:MAG: hypothetical protein V4640_00940 [Verrucomicrobiota bacterium]